MKTEYSKIVRPVLTEKSAVLQTQGIYSFVVKKDATKIDIKNEIEKIYGKPVDAVKMQINPGKIRLIGRAKVMTKRKKTKIARVTLKGKESIDPNKVTKAKKTTKSKTPKTK